MRIGLKNVSTAVQRYIDGEHSTVKWQYAELYLDDVGENFQMPLQEIATFLRLTKRAWHTLKLKRNSHRRYPLPCAYDTPRTSERSDGNDRRKARLQTAKDYKWIELVSRFVYCSLTNCFQFRKDGPGQGETDEGLAKVFYTWLKRVDSYGATESKFDDPAELGTLYVMREIRLWHWRLQQTSGMCLTAEARRLLLKTNWMPARDFKWREMTRRYHSSRMFGRSIGNTAIALLFWRKLIYINREYQALIWISDLKESLGRLARWGLDLWNSNLTSYTGLVSFIKHRKRYSACQLQMNVWCLFMTVCRYNA